MSSKSYWIWRYADYEIFHMMQVHLRREERGYHRPPFWKIATPYASVKFVKEFSGDGGYLMCHINGSGHVSVDGEHYCADTLIELASGTHRIEVLVSNYGGLPAIFVESDVCPSDESWQCNHFAGEFAPVGFNRYFDGADKNPEQFPFSYERKNPVAVKKTDKGVIYDFGKELFGYVNISGCDKAQRMDIYYGESEEEATDTEYSYITDSVCGDTCYRLKQRAFRYINIVSADENCSVTADYEYLPLTQTGSFCCENSLFNEIYEASVYTFHLNCREGFFDGIKRDRWVWSGDAYQSARINRYLFADKEIEERTLIGLIGKEPFEQHINTILDYSLLWIIGLHEHYMTYGDKVFLERIYPMAQKLLAFCETRLNQDGFLEGIGDDWTFIDWSEIDKTGAVCAEQMLLIKVYSAMADMAKVLEKDWDALEDKSQELKKRVNTYYWDEKQGAFIDSYESGKANVTRHANIFAVMYDIATEEQKQSILVNVLKNDAVTKITTPYFAGYELDVLAKLGEFAAVEERINSYWGGMIRLGAQTIWEEYYPDMQGIEHYAMYGGKYEKSLCHAWGAGLIYLFGRYYLGVYATSPGYETFCVEPNLGGLAEISGTVPLNGETVTVKLDGNRLSVMATKAGGILVWKEKEYTLHPNEELVIEC